LFKAHQCSCDAAAWRSSLINIAAGSLGGFAGKLVEHPFDTLKTKLQASQSGSADFLRRCLSDQGLNLLAV
jgi:hypothetical protein